MSDEDDSDERDEVVMDFLQECFEMDNESGWPYPDED